MARRVDWDALARVALPDLEPYADLRAGDDGEAWELRALALGDLHADDVRLRESAVRSCRGGAVRLHHLRLAGCLLEELTLASLDVADAVWRDVVVRSSRVGALLAPGADLGRVQLEGTRLDYVNLRGARLAQVALVGCTVGELDLGGATASQVRLLDCQVDRLLLHDATLSEVDLRGAGVFSGDGLDGLRGAHLSAGQVAHLAPALAAHLGAVL